VYTKREKWYRFSRAALSKEDIEGKIQECNKVLDSSVKLFQVDLYPQYQDGVDIDIQDGMDPLLNVFPDVRNRFLFIGPIAFKHLNRQERSINRAQFLRSHPLCQLPLWVLMMSSERPPSMYTPVVMLPM